MSMYTTISALGGGKKGHWRTLMLFTLPTIPFVAMFVHLEAMVNGETHLVALWLSQFFPFIAGFLLIYQRIRSRKTVISVLSTFWAPPFGVRATTTASAGVDADPWLEELNERFKRPLWLSCAFCLLFALFYVFSGASMIAAFASAGTGQRGIFHVLSWFQPIYLTVLTPVMVFGVLASMSDLVVITISISHWLEVFASSWLNQTSSDCLRTTHLLNLALRLLSKGIGKAVTTAAVAFSLAAILSLASLFQQFAAESLIWISFFFALTFLSLWPVLRVNNRVDSVIEEIKLALEVKECNNEEEWRQKRDFFFALESIGGFQIIGLKINNALLLRGVYLMVSVLLFLSRSL